MTRTNHFERNSGLFEEQLGIMKAKRRILDGRRKRRKPSASHPWRQYKLAQCSTKQ